MIYTITLNPSLDYYIQSDSEIKTAVPNKIHSCKFTAGGKGINVLRMLKCLHGGNFEGKAIGFTAGFTGEHIERLLKCEGLDCDFVKTDGQTRVNVKLSGHTCAEFNASGQSVCRFDFEALLSKLDGLSPNDTVIISGSTPDCRYDMYGELSDRVISKGALCVCDTTKDDLITVCKNGVFLVKPNVYELAEITNEPFVKGALSLCNMGCKNVLLSDGGKGGYLVNESGILYCDVPIKRTVHNTVGAGDSMLAGFVYGKCMKMNDEDCLKSAVAAGSASAYTPISASLDRSLYDEIFQKCSVTRLN